MSKFLAEIKGLRKSVSELLDRNGRSPMPQQKFMEEALEELQVALEEMGAVEEELRQQNKQLIAAQAVAEEERRHYQDLFEFAPGGYIITSRDGVIWKANRTAAELLNVPQQFLVGKPLIVFVEQQQRQSFHAELLRVCQAQGIKNWELRFSPRKGEPVDVSLSLTVVRDQEGKAVALRWLLRDITLRKRMETDLLRVQAAEAARRVELEKEISERNRAEKQLLYNASHDALTGLPNRALFMNHLEHAVEYGKRHENYLLAVLFLDLDRFKVINDSLGHVFGDQLLIAIANRLVDCLRPMDTVARFGGDEFVILLEDLNDISDAIKVAERAQAKLGLPFKLGEQEVFTTASIGIAVSSGGYNQPSALLRDADIAMYRAKSRGLGRYEVFDTDMYIQAVARLQLETDLRQAVERQEFRIHYQPIVALNTGLLTGFEALVRWQHPRRGLVSPSDFLPIAMETELSTLIDRWVLIQACYQIQQWQEQYPNYQHLTISVNIGARQFAQPDLTVYIDQALKKTKLDASSLKLEITESVIMENSESATARLSQLRDLGIQLSIDDFGTGYSSLGRLHHFPINELKIDRSFISKSGVEQRSLEIVETIVALAQKLGVKVTVEGVETKEQLQKLRELKCDYGQGYFFSKPLQHETAEALILKNQQW